MYRQKNRPQVYFVEEKLATDYTDLLHNISSHSRRRFQKVFSSVVA